MNRILLSTALLAATLFGSTEVKAEAALKEGQWTGTVRAGIAPTVMTKSARMTRTYTNTTPGVPVALPAGSGDLNMTNGNFFRRSYSTNFGDLHGLPFATGFDIGYAIQDNVELFFNFDWNVASGKKKTALNEKTTTTLAGVPVSNAQYFSKYKQGSYNSLGFYAGARYYFDMDSKFSPFVGAKLGLIHRSHGKHSMKDVDTYGNLIANTTRIDLASYRAPFMKSSTGFSGGLQAGVDYKVTDQVSVNWMAEVIGSTSLKANKKTNQVHRDAATGLTTFTKVTRNPGSTFSFPITVGVKVRM